MSDPLDPALDAYKVLQVDPEADPDVIQAAFRRLVLKYHPDITPSLDAVARIRAINAAWAILRDPAARAAYDLARRQRATLGAAGASAQASPGSSRSSSAAPVETTPPFGTSRPVPRTATGGPGGSGASATPPPSPRVAPAGGSGPAPAPAGTAVGGSVPASSAGPPPGNPSGSVLSFGRYAGWSLGEIARRDLEYIEWLDRMPIGRNYSAELDQILRRSGRRRAADVAAPDRRGLFRRR